MRARRILHLDMDAFYASVEVLDAPELAGKPVIVGGGGARSVVAACSYEARRRGVRSAMPMRRARSLCPRAVVLKPRRERYSALSREIFSWIGEEAELVEQVSIDEAYVDLSHLEAHGASLEFGRRLKTEIFERFGLVCSVGVAPSKFVAKIASDLRKPDALVQVTESEVLGFLAPLGVERIPGVGPAGLKKLQAMGAATIGDLRGLPREALARRFGKWGGQLFDYARGIDLRPVVADRERKSLGHEQTFERDVEDLDVIRDALCEQADAIAESLAKENLWVRTVTVKVRYADFQTSTRQESFARPMRRGEDIGQVACRLLERTEARRRPLRLAGVSVSGFSDNADPGELPLFPVEEGVDP